MTSPPPNHDKAPPDVVIPPPELRIPRATRPTTRWDGRRGSGTRRARSRGRMHSGSFAGSSHANSNTHRNNNHPPSQAPPPAATSQQPPVQIAQQVDRDPRRRPEHLRRRMEENVKPPVAPPAPPPLPAPSSSPATGQSSPSPSPPASLSSIIRAIPSSKETKRSRFHPLPMVVDLNDDNQKHPPSLGALESSASVADAFDPPQAISISINTSAIIVGNKNNGAMSSPPASTNVHVGIISSPTAGKSKNADPSPTPQRLSAPPRRNNAAPASSITIPKSRPAPSPSRPATAKPTAAVTQPSSSNLSSGAIGASSAILNNSMRAPPLVSKPLKKQTPLQRMAAQSRARAAAAESASIGSPGSSLAQPMSEIAAAKMERDKRLLSRRSSIPGGGIQPPPRKTFARKSLPGSSSKKRSDGITMPISKTARIVMNRASANADVAAANRPIPPPPRKAKNFILPQNIQPSQTAIGSPAKNPQPMRANAIAPSGPDMNADAKINSDVGPNTSSFARPVPPKPRSMRQMVLSPAKTPPRPPPIPLRRQVIAGQGMQPKEPASIAIRSNQPTSSPSANVADPRGQLSSITVQPNQSSEVPRTAPPATHFINTQNRNVVPVSTMQANATVSSAAQSAAAPKPGPAQAAIVTPVSRFQTAAQRSEMSARASAQMRTPQGTFARDPNAPPPKPRQRKNSGPKWSPAVKILVRPSQAERLRQPERVHQTPLVQHTPRVQHAPRVQHTPRLYQTPRVQQSPHVPQTERASEIAARFERAQQQNGGRPVFVAPRAVPLAPLVASQQQPRVVQTGQPMRQVFAQQPVIVRNGPSRSVLPGRQSMPAIRRPPPGAPQRRASVPPQVTPQASRYAPNVRLTRPPPMPPNPPALPNRSYAPNRSPGSTSSFQARNAMNAAAIGYSQMTDTAIQQEQVIRRRSTGGQRPLIIKKFSAPMAPSASIPRARAASLPTTTPVADPPLQEKEKEEQNSAFNKFLARRGKKRGWEAEKNDTNDSATMNTNMPVKEPPSSGMQMPPKRRKVAHSVSRLDGPNVPSQRGNYVLVPNNANAYRVVNLAHMAFHSPSKLAWNIPPKREVRPGSSRSVIYGKRIGAPSYRPWPIPARNAPILPAPPAPPALPFRPETRTLMRAGWPPRPISIPANPVQRTIQRRPLKKAQPPAVLVNKNTWRATPTTPASVARAHAAKRANAFKVFTHVPAVAPAPVAVNKVSLPANAVAASLAVNNATIPNIAAAAPAAMKRPSVPNVSVAVPIAPKRPSVPSVSFTVPIAPQNPNVPNVPVAVPVVAGNLSVPNGAVSAPVAVTKANVAVMSGKRASTKLWGPVQRIAAPEPPTIPLETARKEREARAKQATKDLRVAEFVEETVVDGNKCLGDESFSKIPADMRAQIEEKADGWAAPIALWKWNLAVYDDYCGMTSDTHKNHPERAKQLKDFKDLPFDTFMRSCMA